MTHERQRNWAGNLAYSATEVKVPTTVPEVQSLVARSPKVKALGSRHSFADVADTEGRHVCLDGLRSVVGLDAEARRVTVEAGIRYGELADFLAAEGWALPNLASLPHISVAGAVATGTHGSGVRLGCLSTSVVGLEIVLADGSLTSIRRGDPDFEGAVVSLGALGVVVRLTLAVEPMYAVRQDVYDHLPFMSAIDRFDEVMSIGTSVSLFTTWADEGFDQVWVKRRHPAEELGRDRYGATLADAPRHPIRQMPAHNCTAQLGEPGPWHERLPHFRMEFTPSAGEELQTEYLLPREHAPAALEALTRIRETISPVLQISEIRTVAADDLWLSPAYRRDSVCIHFTWQPDSAAVETLIPQIEATLAPFNPRPHWGKLFSMPVAGSYPRFEDFRRLREKYDPHGKFANTYLARVGLT